MHSDDKVSTNVTSETIIKDGLNNDANLFLPALILKTKTKWSNKVFSSTNENQVIGSQKIGG